MAKHQKRAKVGEPPIVHQPDAPDAVHGLDIQNLVIPS